MNKIRCVITDDEPHALDLVESYVNRIPYLQLVGKCSNAPDLITLLEKEMVDLIFLDIQMPALSGMSVARLLKDGPKIIFTTAFEEYAVESYKVNAIDYLLKPFSLEEFSKAAGKAQKNIFPNQPQQTVSLKNENIIIKADYKLWQIPLNDILYFEGVKDYIRIYRKSVSKVLMPLLSLKTLESRLPESFMRVHRSFIVNLDNIEVIERNQILFDKARITISDKYKEDFGGFVNQRHLL